MRAFYSYVHDFANSLFAYAIFQQNLWGGVVQAYLRKIGTVHKVERLNGILEDMISKLLFGKPTKLWDLYLDQALFAYRIQTHSTTKCPHFICSMEDNCIYSAIQIWQS